MARMYRPLAVLVCAVLVTLALVVGCGGGETALHEYFANLDEASREFDERLEAHRFRGNLESEQDPFDVAREWLNGLAAISSEYVRALEMIDAPTEAEEPHLELVDAAKDLNMAIVSALHRFDEVQSVSEAIELIQHPFKSDDPAISDAARRFSEACSALQGVAAANGVDVILVC